MSSKEAKALDRDYISIKELRMWAVAKFADGFELGSTVILVFDSQSKQVIGVVKTDSREIALAVLSEYLEPEDPNEALDWLKENTRLDIVTVLDPK